MMDKLLLVAFVCISGVSITSGANWNYITNSAYGPSKWEGPCSNGTRQSPIDINSTAATYESMAAFNLQNYATVLSVNFTGENNGHSLQINVPPFRYFVNGGGLLGNFTTAQFHLHWGSSDSKGSEHKIDGKQYAAEIHFVSFNVKYADLSTAANESDGLAVLGAFLEVSGNGNSYYDKIFTPAAQLVNASSTVNITAFKLSDLLPANMSKFYRYPGSLTTPNCYESVKWTVFSDPIKVSSAQISALRLIKANSTMNLVDNFRPIQSLGSRTVRVSFKAQSEATTVGSSEIPTALSHAVAVKLTTALFLLMLSVAFHLN